MNGSTSRRKVVAFVLSGIFPGLGQFYNRQLVKGAAFLVVSGVLCWLAGRAVAPDLLMQNLLRAQDPQEVQLALGVTLILPLGLLLIVWLWSLIDAWRSADR
jgi:hypothetical protein